MRRATVNKIVFIFYCLSFKIKALSFIAHVCSDVVLFFIYCQTAHRKCRSLLLPKLIKLNWQNLFVPKVYVSD